MKFIVSFVVIVFCAAVYGQNEQPKKEQAFIIPPELVLPVVAFQPKCPLKFENVKLLASAERGTSIADDFELRNTGIKSIRDFTVASYSSFGGMWARSRPAKALNNLIFPGAIAPLPGDQELEIVELTDAMRDKFKLRDQKMGGVTVFMIVRVEFADGTVFSDEKTSKALEAYFDKLSQYE